MIHKNGSHRPRRKRRAMSEAQKIKRRREVQSNYYHKHKKLTASFVQRQTSYQIFNDTGMKQCKICEEFKAPEDFYPTKTGAFRLTDDCRECRRTISLENYYRRKEENRNATRNG